MKGIIILEGPDACGKTTLANALVKQYGGKYHHLTYYKKSKEMFKAQLAVMEQAAQQQEEGLVVIDRFWPSDNIYAKVYREGSLLNPQSRMLDRWAMRFGALYVVCVPSRDKDLAVRWHAQMHATRKEMYAPDGRIGEIAKEYREVYLAVKRVSKGTIECSHPARLDYMGQTLKRLRHRADWFTYHRDLWENKSLEEPMHEMVALVRGLRLAQPGWFLDSRISNVLGNYSTADCLLVGDIPSKRGISPVKWPFFGFNDSSQFLSEALHVNSFDENRAVWCNAYPKDLDTLPRLLEKREWRKILAFGKNAEKRLLKLGIKDYVMIEHPSAAFRFKTTSAQTYGEKIRNLLK